MGPWRWCPTRWQKSTKMTSARGHTWRISAAGARITGGLKGVPPTIIDSDRPKTQQFIKDFRLFCTINLGISTM